LQPPAAAVLLCGRNTGFVSSAMLKPPPAVVVSHPIGPRVGLCTVVPISFEAPRIRMPYHVELASLVPPPPWDGKANWAKADMIFAASFSRLDLFRSDRGDAGKRKYIQIVLPAADLRAIQKAILAGLGMMSLTKHL
jgi:uncharacterized protein YifN (PemK superfamily)